MLPAEPEELLEGRSFRDPTFLRFWLERLDGVVFEDPTKHLPWAVVAPQLAKLAGKGATAREEREGRIRAHVILGGTYRTIGQHDPATAEYSSARAIAETGEVSSATLIFLGQRQSQLLACQGRLEDALRMLDEVLEIQAPELSTTRLDTMIRRGYMLAELGEAATTPREMRRLTRNAAAIFGEVLKAVDPGESPIAERVHYSAVHNLAGTLSRLSTSDAWKALEYVREARELLKGKGPSVARARLDWIEALIWREVGMDARAETAFQVARRRLLKLGVAWEIAFVSLDLAALYREHSQWQELETLAADTFQRFRELSGNTEAVAALSLWVDAVKARSGVTAAIAAARETVEARMARP